MQNSLTKLAAALLVGVMGFQVWILRGQDRLEQQVRNLSSQQNQTDDQVRRDVSGMESRLRELAEAERWVVVQQVSVEPNTSCESAQAVVQWDLLQWTAGTKSLLLYRNEPDQTWQEAKTESRGGQGYQATFPVSGKPVLHVGTSVSYARGTNRNRMNVEASASSDSPSTGSVQYQIVAEGDSSSRSSGVKALPLVREFLIPIKIMVDVNEGGRYLVELFTEAVGSKRCATVESAQIRGFADDRQVIAAPFKAGNQPNAGTPSVGETKTGAEWVADWQSDEPLTRLELVIRHSGGEDVVPIEL